VPRSPETLRSLVRRLEEAPQAFTTRRVPREGFRCLAGGDLRPRPGDLVLAEVAMLGHHRRLHLPDGRLRTLFRGDAVVLAYGDRYASSQFEARVPADLGPCHLAAGGGIAAQVVERHQRIRRGVTALRPLGLVTSGPDEPPLNVASFARPRPRTPLQGEIPVIAVLGSAMDSGKTTSAAHLVRGLTRVGLRAGYAKVTGTGAAGDPMLVTDAGAFVVRDFTDVGHATTYRLSTEALEEVLVSLIGQLRDEGAEIAVLEIADGLLQPETKALLASPHFRSLVNGILLAARDSMSALAGAEILRRDAFTLLGLCGSIEAAPLEVREAQATELPVWGRHDLDDPQTASKLVHAVRRAA